MFGRSRFSTWLIAVMAWSLGGLVLAQEGTPPKDKPPAPEDIKQDKPSFMVRADVNHATHSYRENDALSITVTSEVDAYLYVVYKQCDGKMYQIFPNSVQRDNRVKARQAIQVPAQDDLFRWVVSAPYGKETVTVLASKEPIDALSHPSMKAERFNPVTPSQVKGIELELGEEKPTDWAEDHIEITTYEGTETRAKPGSRRVGVFFGISDYAFHKTWVQMHSEEIEDGPDKGKTRIDLTKTINLETRARDARRMAEILQEVGQLDEVQIYTNDQVTKAAMEEVITKKLPSITRPGDTVFIFYSGRSMQMPDDNNDEADGLDECLLPHDFVNFEITEYCVKLSDEEKAKLRGLPAVAINGAVNAFKKSGSPAQGKTAILQNAAITDDLFSHWLQRLSGRQIVMMMDTYLSVDQFKQEGVSESLKDPFDFAVGEAARLNRLGQRDMALLAVCMPPLPFGISMSTDGHLTAMTGAIVGLLRESKDAVTIEQAFDGCKQGVAAYFGEANQKLQEKGREPQPALEPILQNHSKRPIVLRP